MFRMFQVFNDKDFDENGELEFLGTTMIKISTITKVIRVNDDFSVISCSDGELLVLGNFIKIAEDVEEKLK